MLLARVPVPWGSEPKAQTVYGLTKGTLWYNESQRPIPVKDFDESDVDIDVIHQKLVVTPTKSKDLYQEIAPTLLKWAVLKGVLRRAAPPTQAKLQVMAFPRSDTTTWVEQLPPSLLDWATNRGIKRSEKPEKLIPLDPFSTKSRISSIETRQQVFEALKRGEWCFIYELDDDLLPPLLRRWLIECKVRFIRYVGGGRVGAGTPVNGYVTEDGTVFYVAEDGSTFYVQET